MERIIDYDELPASRGQSIYLRMETDPKLYISLLSKGYRLINNITSADNSTIYVTGRRQDFICESFQEYKAKVDSEIQSLLMKNGIIKPKTSRFCYEDLLRHKYKLPFVLKNENQNGGREKFLIATEEDYKNLINACNFLLDRKLLYLIGIDMTDIRCQIDYASYLTENFTIQEYIQTPSEFNTTIRILTSASNDLLYAALKYNKPELCHDETTLLGYLLTRIYPLSTMSIVSNTLSGGKNILIGACNYTHLETSLLSSHNIDSDQFQQLVEISQRVHEERKAELGIICGFDYIYDKYRKKWFLLEYHSRPMVGDYSRRQGITYETPVDKLTAEGRVRATALSLVLKKR